MPVNNDKAYLSSRLLAWFKKYNPRVLQNVTGEQFISLCNNLIVIGDIYKACREIEFFLEVRANEELFYVLLGET